MVYLESKNRKAMYSSYSTNQQYLLSVYSVSRWAWGTGVTRVSVLLKLCMQERNREREKGEREERSVGGRERRERVRGSEILRTSQHGCV